MMSVGFTRTEWFFWPGAATVATVTTGSCPVGIGATAMTGSSMAATATIISQVPPAPSSFDGRFGYFGPPRHFHPGFGVSFCVRDRGGLFCFNDHAFGHRYRW
jgi:hypothetical protein